MSPEEHAAAQLPTTLNYYRQTGTTIEHCYKTAGGQYFVTEITPARALQLAEHLVRMARFALDFQR